VRSDVLRVLAVACLLGLAALPITRAALAPLPACAAGLARPLGLLLGGVALWICVSVGLCDYTTTAAWLSVSALALAGGALALRERRRGAGERRAWRRWRPDAASVGAEVVFFGCFAAATFVVAHAPDVWGTEKPMDMAILGATQNAQDFPPADPWLSGERLNYYYLGQYLMGFVMRLAGVGPTEGYNLAVALVFALAAAAAFAVGAAAARALAPDGRGAVLGGSLATLLTVAGSNVEGLRLLLTHDGELDWFAASRIVPGAINDFPALELVVGDLHAHVIAVPFTLLVLAFVLHAVLHEPRFGARAVIAAIAVGALYPINTWSYPVCLALLLAAGALRSRSLARFAGWAAGVVAVSVLVYLPFQLGFDTSGARGIALTPERRELVDFLGDLVRVYGFALLALLAALALALVPAIPRRARAGALVAAVVLAAVVAVAGDLGGPLLLLVALAGAVAGAVRADGARRFAFLLLAGGLGCALVPELVYVRDGFEGTPYYRMNTLFKVGFQAWLLFGIGAGVVLAGALRRLGGLGVAAAIAAGVALVAFPVAAARTKTSGFASAATLDGLGWLDRLAPGDRPAIAWLREHAPRDAVVLEATGPEYSPQGHARIATFSGRPTVIGWAAHLLFQGPASRLGTRVADVNELYETVDRARAEALLRRYDVAYVVVGPTERVSHPGPGLEKFALLGRRVFQRAGTAVYELPRT
jgi:YYY domain-containing protein